MVLIRLAAATDVTNWVVWWVTLAIAASLMTCAGWFLRGILRPCPQKFTAVLEEPPQGWWSDEENTEGELKNDAEQ